MFKSSVTETKKFWLYFSMLMLSGLVLFVLGVLMFPPFRDLVVLLNSNESAPIKVWIASGSLALILGSFWLCFYILFEAAKKGIVDLIHKN